MPVDHSSPSSPNTHRSLRIVLMAIVMAAIFALDTSTRYEVAIAVFYAVVIFISAPVFNRRKLIVLAVICALLTSISFVLTPRGDWEAGLLNMSISIAVIILMTFLTLKAEKAHIAAHDAQAKLMRLARVKSLEGLTTSIAHEVNQPLAAIVTSGNACQRWLAQDPPNIPKAHQALERILSDAGRASTIITRVRSLTKGEPPHKSAFDFNKAVLEILALSQGEMQRSQTELITALNPDLPPALADRVQIQQVVGNLVLNAIEALTSKPPGARRIRVTSSLEKNTIVFAVFDSGTGIPTGVYEHLFEAFWTTKEEGIGVGLSISRTIIEANGGQIWAASNDGGGAVFRFSVPIALQDQHL